MKNKSEKLARNAIRARKAKNKRANEQDKPKKGKRWLIRLGALMGCLLLVSALVVPCFADYPYDPTYTITDDYYSAFLQYNVSENLQDSDVFMSLINYYRRGDHSNGWNGLFENGLLYYTQRGYHDDVVRLVDARLVEDSVLYGNVAVDHIVFNIKERNSSGDGLFYAFDGGEFMYDIRSSGDDVFLIVDFRAEFDLVEYQIIFTAYDYTYSSDEQVEFEGDSYAYQVYENDVLVDSGPLGIIEVAYTGQNPFMSPLSLQSYSLLNDVLFTPSYLSYYHPLAFANGYYAGQLATGTYSDGYNAGYSTGYNTGKNEGYVIGHNDGREEGYSTGLEEGYDEGYEIGFESGWEGGDDAGFERGYNYGYDLGYEEGSSIFDADYDEAYKHGYNAAVSEIDSGEFGENFIGNILSAPVRALNSFTLLTTPNGVNITLGGILACVIGLSLFFAFIKMFGR